MEYTLNFYKEKSREAMRECLIRRKYKINNPHLNIDPDFGKDYWLKAKHFALLAARL